DCIRKRATHSRNERALVLGIAYPTRGELGRSQLHIGAGKLGMQLDGVAWIDRLIAQCARSMRARRKEVALLDEPAIAMRQPLPYSDDLPAGIAFWRFNGHRLLPDRAQTNDVADCRTCQ